MRNWDQLRNDVRRLEQELDERLSALVKLYHNVNTDGAAGGQGTVSLIQGKSSEIEALLGQLSTCVDGMESCMGSATSRVHVYQSHKDILNQYRADFKRTQNKIRTVTEHQELLRGAQQRHKAATGDKSAEAGLQSERQHATAANVALDGVLETGQSLAEELKKQRNMFNNMFGTIDQIKGQMPSISSLVENIKRKRKRDLFVLAGVIAALLVVTLVWIM